MAFSDAQFAAIQNMMREILTEFTNNAGSASEGINRLGTSASEAGGAMSNFAQNLPETLQGFSGEVARISVEAARRAEATTQMQSGRSSAALSVVPEASVASIPFIMTERQAELAATLEATGLSFTGLIAELTDAQAQLGLSEQDIINLARDAEVLRATGGSAREGLEAVVTVMQELRDGGAITTESLKMLGIGFEDQATFIANFAQILGPSIRSLNGGFEDLDDVIESNMVLQNSLSQVYGVSIEQQMQNTEQMMSSTGAIALTMKNITDPAMINNLSRFANVAAAIGDSGLAEGFIGGAGIPTPGNEIMAALKPQTAALMAEMNRALAEGDQERYLELERRLPEVSAAENQRTLQTLGPQAMYLQDEVGQAVRSMAEDQRARMMAEAYNQQTGQGSFTGAQMAAAGIRTETLLETPPGLVEAITTAQQGIAQISVESLELLAAALRTQTAEGIAESAAVITQGISGAISGVLGDTASATLTALSEFENMSVDEIENLILQEGIVTDKQANHMANLISQGLEGKISPEEVYQGLTEDPDFDLALGETLEERRNQELFPTAEEAEAAGAPIDTTGQTPTLVQRLGNFIKELIGSGTESTTTTTATPAIDPEKISALITEQTLTNEKLENLIKVSNTGFDNLAILTQGQTKTNQDIASDQAARELQGV